MTTEHPKQLFEPVRLGTLEQLTMDALWDHGPLTIREVINCLDRDFAYTTIATVLANLQRKQLITSERHGRSVRFDARHSRELHTAQIMEQALSSSGDRAASILHFVEAMDPDDVELLRNYLAARGDST